MQMCQSHWEQLRADISKYGLDHLIAPDSKAAMEMLERQLKGEDGPLDFDPLMAANNQLLSIAMDYIGQPFMFSPESGTAECPACALRDYNWVEGAAYQSRLYAEKNGLALGTTEGAEGNG